MKGSGGPSLQKGLDPILRLAGFLSSSQCCSRRFLDPASDAPTHHDRGGIAHHALISPRLTGKARSVQGLHLA